MLKTSRFYGIIIKMYFNDTSQHHKPHIHAFYGDYEAVIAIDGQLLAGSMPVKQQRLLTDGLLSMKNRFMKLGIMRYVMNILKELIHYSRRRTLDV